MTEPLTDAERQALEWLRAGAHRPFRRVRRAVRDGLFRRGLVRVARPLSDERYGLTHRGLAALDAPRG
jgi:hypothetical protein